MVQAICESYDGTLFSHKRAVHFFLSEHANEIGIPDEIDRVADKLIGCADEARDDGRYQTTDFGG
jgi:hypothetical protein